MPTLAFQRPVSGRAVTVYGISICEIVRRAAGRLVAERHGRFVRRAFVRLDRLGLHRVILLPARQAVFVRSAIGHRRDGEIPVGRRGGRVHSRVVASHGLMSDLFAAPHAPEEIDDERNLRQAHHPRGNRDRRVPMETAQAPYLLEARVQPSPPSYQRRCMPSMPCKNIGRKITFMQMSEGQKCTFPQKSFILRPVAFGNQ